MAKAEEKPDLVESDAVERKGIRGDPFWKGWAILRDKRRGDAIGPTKELAKDRAYDKAKALPVPPKRR